MVVIGFLFAVQVVAGLFHHACNWSPSPDHNTQTQSGEYDERLSYGDTVVKACVN